MAHNLPNDDDTLFVRRLLDLCGSVKKRAVPRYTAFLNEREQAIATETLAREHGVEFAFFGGYEGAVRKMAAIYPDYLDSAGLEYPLIALTVQHAKGEKLSHRDVLGSLMGLGLSRSGVGDILPDDGECRFLALSTVAEMLMDELRQIGRIGVGCSATNPEELAAEQEYEEIYGTVSSARLDSMVKLFTNLSREKAAGLVRAGMVQKNYASAEQPSAGVSARDIVTVRGYGKYIVDVIGEPTRKGRLPVNLRKYK